MSVLGLIIRACLQNYAGHQVALLFLPVFTEMLADSNTTLPNVMRKQTFFEAKEKKKKIAHKKAQTPVFHSH